MHYKFELNWIDAPVKIYQASGKISFAASLDC